MVKVNNLRVLVVDDDVILLEMCAEILESEGYIVTTAHDGSEALRKLYKDSVDGVLLDVMMPGIDGLAVCKTLKHDPHFAGIPVIMMSASHSAQQQAAICSDAVLAKPFELDNLIDTMHLFVHRN